MKKITLVSLASFVFLFICSSVEYILRPHLENVWIALAFGILLLILSGVIAIFAKESVRLNLVCFLISAVAMGFLIRAWYINRGFDNTYGVMMLVSLAAVLYLWIFFAGTRLPFIKGKKLFYVIYTVLYFVISVVGYIIVVFNTKTTYVSTFGYYMFIEAAFILAMSLKVDTTEELIRNLTLSTYSVFAVAVIVLIFAIFAALGDGDCDCDCSDGCCECLDCSGGCETDNSAYKARRRRGSNTP